MEELKNVRHFQEFKDSLNEELLFDAIRNLFSKLFGKIDKKLADAVANFTKKLDGSKDWNDSVRIFEQSTKDRQTIANQSMTSVTGPLGLRKVLHDNASVVFIELQEMSNKYQSPALAAKKIFEGQPEAQMFNFDKAEDFTKNALNAVNAKMLEINKETQSYKPDELQKYLQSNTDVNKVETAPTNTNTTPTNTTTPQTNTNNTNQPKPANKTIDPKDMTGAELKEEYEYDASGNPVSTRNKNTNNTNNNQPKPDQNQQNTNTNQQQNQQSGAPQGDVNKLKQGSTNWLTNNLYGYSLKKLKEVKAPAVGAGGADPFDAISKGSKAVDDAHRQSLSKLLRNIVNIPDKNTLIKVRNAIATAQGKQPDDFVNDMPF